MGVLDTLENGMGDIISLGTELVASHKAQVITAVAGVTALGVGGVVLAKTIGKKRKARKKKTSRGRSRDRKFISKQKHEKAYVRRKKKKGKKITRKRYKTRSKKTKKKVGKIYYTKKGQPYKILSSGKARFIRGKRRFK